MLITVVDRQNARDIIQDIYDIMNKTSNPTDRTDPNQPIDIKEFIKSVCK